MIDGEKHRAQTGVDNDRILANARRLAEWARQGEADGSRGVWVRVPVIPTINDDEENTIATARFVREEMDGVVQRVELLGYHRLGGAKSLKLGTEPTLTSIEPPGRELMAEIRAKWEEALEGTNIRVNAR